jgi:hypothetical protein
MMTDSMGVLDWLLLIVCAILVIGGCISGGYKSGIDHCLSRPAPSDCIPMDTTITPRGR